MRNPPILAMKITAVVATAVALVATFNHFAGSYQKDVEENPKQELAAAFDKTFKERDETGYTPLKTGTEAAQSGVITATTVNKAGESLKYTLVQDPVQKSYASSMSNTSANTGWQWQLVESIANVQAGTRDSEWYSVDLSDPADAAERLENLRTYMGLSVEKMTEKLGGNYPAFLTAYNANNLQSDSRTNAINAILSYMPDTNVSVSKSNVKTKDGDKIDTVRVEYTITNENMKLLLDDIKEALSYNEDGYAAYIDDIFRDVLKDAGCDFYDVSGAVEDSIAELRWKSTLNGLAVYLMRSDADFTAAFELSTKTKNIVGISISSSDTIKEEKVIAEVSMELPMDYKAEKYDTVFSVKVVGDKRERFDNDLTITESITNDATAYSRSVLVTYKNARGTSQESYTREYNKKNNTFVIGTVWNGQALEVSGTVTVMGSEMRMEITKAIYGNTTYDLAVSVSADTQVGEWFKSNAVSNATKIETLSDGELSKLQDMLAKHLPSDRFGAWVKDDFDMSVYETFDPKFDYDGDGDVDEDDREFYEVVRKMMGLN